MTKAKTQEPMREREEHSLTSAKHSMSKKKIGIVSGMGAMAGVHLLKCLIRKCQEAGAKADSDFPEVVLHNVPSRGLDEHGIADPVALKADLLSSVEFLNASGCNLILIACNTAHVYLQDLQAESKVTILDMIAIAAEEAVKHGNVGVLSSSSTKELGLYRRAIKEHGRKCVETTNDQQDAIDVVISQAIAGTVCAAAAEDFFNIIASMTGRSCRVHPAIRDGKGIGCVLLGCTELPLIPLISEIPVPIIDAGEKAIERALSL